MIIIIIMYSKYLFIGTCAVSGALIYNALGNLCLKPNIYEGRKDIFNFGMLLGLSIGTGISYLNKN